MAKAAVAAVVVAVGGAGLSFLMSKAYRCIDTPEFYYPLALVYAWVGVGLVLFGVAARASVGRGVAVGVIAVGVLLVSLALAGPRFKDCGQFDGFRRSFSLDGSADTSRIARGSRYEDPHVLHDYAGARGVGETRSSAQTEDLLTENAEVRRLLSRSSMDSRYLVEDSGSDGYPDRRWPR